MLLNPFVEVFADVKKNRSIDSTLVKIPKCLDFIKPHYRLPPMLYHITQCGKKAADVWHSLIYSKIPNVSKSHNKTRLD
jgi:hypothetical protein